MTQQAYGLNPKTVAKWLGRTGTADAPMGPTSRRLSGWCCNRGRFPGGAVALGAAA